ncbi:acyl-CoA dehydrogenase family protein [Paraconexibacter sp.]|uniref:acyl-CoA dehydrogenase family protein n=1 Tax=Paraconexibacter sp. TaxID=2949640 RepID=UPI003563405B
MNFDFSDDQHEIKRTARDLLGKRSTLERVRAAAESRAYDESLWAELVELGWPGIAIAEEHGGGGLGVVELATLLEEGGYALAGSPFLATAVCGLVLQEAAAEDLQATWLPRLASGEVTGTVGAVDGLVPDAEAAAVIVLVEDGGASARLLTREQASVEPVDAIDPTRRYARVSAAPGVGHALSGDLTAALDRGRIAVSAELVGISARALEMSVEYVKERKQFGVPVGSFQAVQHRAAQMLLHTEGARSATYFAAWAADADPSRLAEGAALAKAAASEAGREVTASAIQVHGGIGFTWEADVHWFYKRAQVDAAYLGGAGSHRATLARIAAAKVATA